MKSAESLTGRSRLGLPLLLTLMALLLMALIQAGRPSEVVDAGPLAAPATQPGFPAQLSGGRIEDSSPTLANIDSDDELEILIGGLDGSCQGKLYAYNHDGSLKWERQTSGPINSTPAVADIDGDGQVEVVVGIGGWADYVSCADGGLIAVNGATGAQEWFFATADWLFHSPDGHTDGVFSSPTIDDVDGDGDLEVAFGGWDQCIYLLDAATGTSLWGRLPGIYPDPYCNDRGFYNEDTIWSSPVLYDLTRDGNLEIIIGADITAGNVNGDPTGGYVYVLDKDGTQLAREWLDQAVYSSPAVADLDEDGTPEIVVGTGAYIAGTGYYVTAYNYNGGVSDVRDRLQQKWRTSVAGHVFSSPAIGDLNEDGTLDVVFTSLEGDWGSFAGSWVYALDGDDGSIQWQRPQCDRLDNSFEGRSSPTLADIDGDDHLEVLFAHSWEVSIINHDGWYYTDHGIYGSNNAACAATPDGTTNDNYVTNFSVFGSPAVGDIDLDGDLEIVIGSAYSSSHSGKGGLYAWTGHPMPGEDKLPWPMFHRDALNSGHYPMPPRLEVSPTSFYIMHQYGCGATEQTNLTIENTGDELFSWTATPPANVTVSPSSGTVFYTTPVTVTITTSGYITGTHSLGNIQITGTAGGSPVDGNPAQIPVTLYVGNVSRVYLPLVLRSAN